MYRALSLIPPVCHRHLYSRLVFHTARLTTMQATLSIIHNTDVNIAPNPKFRAVVFDLGGVFMPSIVQLVREIEKSYNMKPLSLGKRIEACQEFCDLQRGKLDLEEFLTVTTSKGVFKDLVPADKLREVIFRIFGSVTFENGRYKCVTEAARCLRADGVRTALLTNNWMVNRNFLEHPLPINRNLFDAVVESHRLGIRKPDRDMFLVALRQLGVAPTDAVIVDCLGRNLKVARQLGIHTVKAESPQQIVDDLERLLNLSLCHYVPGTITPPNHFRLALDKLKQYLDANFGPKGNISVRQFVPSTSRSNLTYFVVHGDRKLVLRRKWHQPIDAECQLLLQLGKTTEIPVPNVVCHCPDSTVIGCEFFVMDYIDGTIHHPAHFQSMPSVRVSKILTEMNRILAKIHQLDVKSLGIDLFLNGEGSRLLHGDFHLENVIFHPKNNHQLLSVIDWKNACLSNDQFHDLKHLISKSEIVKNFRINDHIAEYCQFAKLDPLLGSRVFDSFVESKKREVAGFVVSTDNLSSNAKSLYDRVSTFVELNVAPFEKKLLADVGLLEELKCQAKRAGLWNLWHHVVDGELTNCEFAHFSELLGRYYPFGPSVFNCAEPGASNMALLLRGGSEQQRARWLEHLLSGEIKSSLVFDEKLDVKNEIADVFVLNGRGLCSYPQCHLAFVPWHGKYLLVPTKTQGVKVMVGGKVEFDNVCLKMGEVFVDANSNGDYFHLNGYMHMIGMAARALDQVRLAGYNNSCGVEVARNFAELEQARLLVLKAAHFLDHRKKAALEVEIVKTVVPEVTQRISAMANHKTGLPNSDGFLSETQLANGWQRITNLLNKN